MDELNQYITAVIFAMLRLSPLVLSSALTPMSKIPMAVRILFLIVFSIMAVFVTSSSVAIGSLMQWAITGMLEVMLGIVFVFAIQIAVSGLLTLGRVVDMQIGFGAAGIIDPKTHNNESLTGTLLMMVFMLLFFQLNFHHEMLSALVLSFKLIPIGGFSAQMDIYYTASALTQQFFLALILCLPIILALFILDIMIGFSAKTMPQMNIYFIGLPLKIGVGLVVFSFVAHKMLPGFERIFNQINIFWIDLLGLGNV